MYGTVTVSLPREQAAHLAKLAKSEEARVQRQIRNLNRKVDSLYTSVYAFVDLAANLANAAESSY